MPEKITRVRRQRKIKPFHGLERLLRPPTLAILIGSLVFVIALGLIFFTYGSPSRDIGDRNAGEDNARPTPTEDKAISRPRETSSSGYPGHSHWLARFRHCAGPDQ